MNPTTTKPRVWSEQVVSPPWASNPIRRVWHYKAARGTVTLNGIALSWKDALEAVERLLKGAAA